MCKEVLMEKGERDLRRRLNDRRLGLRVGNLRRAERKKGREREIGKGGNEERRALKEGREGEGRERKRRRERRGKGEWEMEQRRGGREEEGRPPGRERRERREVTSEGGRERQRRVRVLSPKE